MLMLVIDGVIMGFGPDKGVKFLLRYALSLSLLSSVGALLL